MVDIVGISLAVDSKGVVKGTKDLKNLSAQGKKTETATDKMSKSFKLLGTAIGAIGVIALTKKLVDQINVYTALTNKLKLVTNGSKNLADIQKVLFDVAQDTRGPLEGTIDLYAKLARSTKSLGLSQNELVDVTSTINKTIAISGANATQAAAAIMQLGQGLSSGALRGEEFNSISEQTPALLTAIAAGMDVERGALKNMAAEGKLTSEVIVKALQNQAEAVDKEFGQTSKTIAQALIQIENVALRTFGSLDGTDLVNSLDDFRKIISDPEIVAGLQSIAKLLVDIAGLAIKAASGWGMIFGGIAKAASAGSRDAFEKLNDRIRKAQSELGRTNDKHYRAVLTANIERYKKDLAAMTEAKVAEEKARKVAAAGGGKTAGGTTFDDKKIKELDALRENYKSEEQLLADKYARENQLLIDARNAGKDVEDLFMDIQFEREIALFDRQREQIEIQDAIDEEKLAKKQNYWDRLFNLEAGSQKASLEFGKAMRDKDYKSALQNGALMLANSAKNSKAMFEVQKAFSLANAVVALPSAVLKSFENGGGYPWGLVPAGLMLAQGLQQIQAINSAQFGGGTSTASVGGSTSSSAPVASGLPSGSTAVEDASEQSQGTTTINLVGEDKTFSSDQIDSLFGEIGDALERGDRVLFSSTSRQALELTG